ncbi:MAG: ABC transporter permease [Flavobacteriales bacterium]|nr:ABC transporter permease [Flavobacteriales bacterium]
MKISKEVKIGFVMLLAIALLFWGANFLKGHNIFSKHRVYYAVYEHVDRLAPSNPVTVNGFKVGQVESVQFIPDNSGRLLVKFSVTEENLIIPEDTKAEIVSLDILGSKAVDLKLGRAVTQASINDTLKSGLEATLTETVNQEIAPLKKKAEDLMSTVDSAIIVISTIFNERARDDLDKSFSSIRGSLETFNRTMNRIDGLVAEEREHLNKIFENVESISSNLAENNQTLTNSLENIEAITDSLAGANLRETVQNASIAMKQLSEVVDKVNNGEGTMGMLINNDTLYRNLEASAADLDKLLLDMQLNPERYVHFSIFGRKDKDKKKK